MAGGNLSRDIRQLLRHCGGRDRWPERVHDIAAAFEFGSNLADLAGRSIQIVDCLPKPLQLFTVRRCSCGTNHLRSCALCRVDLVLLQLNGLFEDFSLARPFWRDGVNT